MTTGFDMTGIADPKLDLTKMAKDTIRFLAALEKETGGEVCLCAENGALAITTRHGGRVSAVKTTEIEISMANFDIVRIKAYEIRRRLRQGE